MTEVSIVVMICELHYKVISQKVLKQFAVALMMIDCLNAEMYDVRASV